jgi:hypothetical protein
MVYLEAVRVRDSHPLGLMLVEGLHLDKDMMVGQTLLQILAHIPLVEVEVLVLLAVILLLRPDHLEMEVLVGICLHILELLLVSLAGLQVGVQVQIISPVELLPLVDKVVEVVLVQAVRLVQQERQILVVEVLVG